MARLLVVEDDRAICDVMIEALHDGGFDAECAQDDRGAYARIAEAPWLDGLVLDVNLGTGTTGYDVARYARRKLPRIAVMYVSGQSSEHSFRRNGVPGSGFLAKPFSSAQLVDRVRALFGAPDRPGTSGSRC